MRFSQQIRAARAVLDWTQNQLSERSGISAPTIRHVEDDKEIKDSTRTALINALEDEGLFLTAHGIELSDEKVLLLDSFLEVLKNMKSSCAPGMGVLFHCADERRNSPEVTAAIADLAAAGFQLRFTLCEGNELTTTAAENYRWIDAEYFASSEVLTVYEDKVVIDVSEEERDQFLLIKNRHLAKAMKRQFEYWWRQGCPIGERKST